MRQDTFDRANDKHHDVFWVDLGLNNNVAVYSNQQVASGSQL